MKHMIMLIAAMAMFFLGATAAATFSFNPIQIFNKYFSSDQPQDRTKTGSKAAKAIHSAMLGAADEGTIRLRKQEMTPYITEELKKDIGSVYVVELIVPANDLRQPMDKRMFTPLGMGKNTFDAISKSNTIKAFPRVYAIDYDRSKFLVAVLVNGELYWREVPRPEPDVLREKVEAARLQSELVQASSPTRVDVKRSASPSQQSLNIGGERPSTTGSSSPSDDANGNRGFNTPDPKVSDGASNGKFAQTGDAGAPEAIQSAPDSSMNGSEILQAGTPTIVERGDAARSNQPSVSMGGERPSATTSSDDDSSNRGFNTPDPKGSDADSSGGDKNLPADTYSDGARVLNFVAKVPTSKSGEIDNNEKCLILTKCILDKVESENIRKECRVKK